MSEKLRITGGDKRGRKIFSPPANSIRPASDMIRQAVFNMIRPDLEGAEFYDVFAGTGVVGIEAISRGADRAIFIEYQRRQISLIQRNVKHVGLEAQSDIRFADAFLWAKHFVPGKRHVIVYLGPPYEMFEPEELERTMGLVVEVQKRLRRGDILGLQFASEVPTETLPGTDGWYRVRKYGKTKVGLWTPPKPEEEPASDDESPEA